MEESEKRRERLKALRMEAAEAGVSDSQVAATAPSSLSNPLLEPFPSGPSNSQAAPRFDFYTDPMSMYTNNTKKRNNDLRRNRQGYISPPIIDSPMGPNYSTFAGPRNPDRSPTPNQFQVNYSPDHRSFHTPIRTPMSCSWRSPPGVPSPYPGQQGTPPGYLGSWNHSGGSPGHGRGHFYNPDSGPRINSGRGSFNFNISNPSPGSGRGRGRGRGSHGHVTAQERPDMFYSKSMVEDPWKYLAPVVRILKYDPSASGSAKSWLPKSVGMKKAKFSEDVPEFSFQTSIADCLSSAFQETVEDVAET